MKLLVLLAGILLLYAGVTGKYKDIWGVLVTGNANTNANAATRR